MWIVHPQGPNPTTSRETLFQRLNIVKLYTLFKRQDLKNYTQFVDTRLFQRDNRIPPSPPFALTSTLDEMDIRVF